MAAYESHDGYAGARTALKGMAPADVIDLVREANLRGRGGAGFGTGMKWGFVPQGEDVGLKYLVCNADEMEPGTFKDRYLLEYNPHILIEGMIVGAWAIGAAEGYVFMRGEYHEPYRSLLKAIEEAYAKGYLGTNILGSGFDFELRIHRSGGGATSAAKRPRC